MLLVAIWFLKLTFGPLSTSAPNVDPVRPYKMPRFTLCGPMAWAQKQCLRQGGESLHPMMLLRNWALGPARLHCQCSVPAHDLPGDKAGMHIQVFIFASIMLTELFCLLSPPALFNGENTVT